MPRCRDSVRRGSIFPLAVFAARTRLQVLAVCGLLLLAVGFVFGQTVRYEFVNMDDSVYVYENPMISRGLTVSGIAWVFTHSHAGNWHPVTGLSHILDCQFYGLDAGRHHLTNVLLHAATAILLFLVLWRMTGGLWASALVAALFAVHPLRVESVAWVAEQKDVLSGLFFMLTLGTYLWYVRGPFSRGRYGLLVVVFALGLMAKPMLVTLPLVLLLLDYWPLGRMARAAANGSVAGGGRAGRFSFPMRLLFEKLPLLLVAAVFCVVTLWAQGRASALDNHLTASWRIGNALVSCVTYIVQVFCPVGLAAYYPHPELRLPIWEAIGALVALTCISAGVLAGWRRCPYVFVGWLWYLGMLVPVIGLIQQGSQARADRFTYLPQIGLYVALAWGAADACRSWPYRRWVCSVASVLVLVVLMGCAWRQTSFWQDSKTLWIHALACTSRNNVAHNNLGLALADLGRLDEAIAQYQKALEIRPNYMEAHINLGIAMGQRGRPDEVIAHYRKALEIKPGSAIAQNNLGAILVSRGRPAEAVPYYQQALKIDPDYVQARVNLASALATVGRFDEAIAEYRKALGFQPDNATACNNLGAALVHQGRLAEAVPYYQQALKIDPNYLQAHVNLASALAILGRLDEAIVQYRKALEIQPDNAETHADLGSVLFRQGRMAEALPHFRKTVEISPNAATFQNNLGVVLANQGCLEEALIHFRRALEIQPDHAEAHKNVAWLRQPARTRRCETAPKRSSMAGGQTNSVPASGQTSSIVWPPPMPRRDAFRKP